MRRSFAQQGRLFSLTCPSPLLLAGLIGRIRPCGESRGSL